MRNNYIFDPVTTNMFPAKYAYEHEMMSEEEKAEFEEGLPRYGFRGVAGMLDLKARLAMLRLHLADRPLERGIDYPRLVELSEGMNASDLETMVNEAALEAAIHHQDITQEMLEDRAIQGRRSIQAPEEDSKQQIQEVHITASNTRVRGFNAYLEEDRQVV